MSIEVKISAVYGEFVSATKQLGDIFGGIMDGMKAELKDMSDEAKVQMKGHESASEQFANILKSHMMGVTGAVEGVKIAWAQLGVIFEAAHFLAETVSKTVELTTNAEKLGRGLGISATQASVLNLALSDVHGTSDEFLTLTKGLDKQLATHEESLKRAGVATRDANGDLKDQQTLVMEGLDALRQYKEGTDRNIAATQIFGQGVHVSNEMLALNAEKLAAAKEKADALGLAVGKDDKEAADRFRSAMNDLTDISDALMKQIGSALLPVLDDLAEFFLNYGPQAILALKVAIDLLITVFKGLGLTVKVVYEVVALAFKNMIEVGHGFATVFSDLFHGDFAGAKEAAEGMMTSMAQNMGQAFDNIMKSAAATGSAVTDIWDKTINGRPVQDSGVEAGGTADVDTSKITKPKDTSAADARKANAELQKALKERYDLVQEELRGEEQAARDSLQAKLAIQQKELAAAIAMYGEKSKEAEKFENAIVETKRQIAEQDLRMQRAAADERRQIELMQLEDVKSDAQVREQNGEITYAALLQQEREYEDNKFNLLMQGLQEEADANIARVEDHQQTLLKMEELSAQHAIAIGNIEQDAAQSRAELEHTMAEQVVQGWAGTIAKLVTFQMSFHNALKQIWKQMLASFTQYLTNKIIASKAAAAVELAVEKMVAALLRVLHIKSAADSVKTTIGAADSKLVATAPVAGAKAAEAVADIPYVGPILAAAAMAAMIASILGLRGGGGGGGSVPSAAGGFDIPAGMNPLTQLHQREMVLPEAQADVVRGLAGNGGGGGDVHVHVHAVDADSVRRLFMGNKRALADAMRAAFRDGMSVGAF